MSRLAFVKSVWQDMLANGGIERAVMGSLSVHAAVPNLVTARFQIGPQHTNRLGSIHGGVVSTLVDIGGSLALSSQGMFMTGVTTDLATTFLAAGGKPGDWLQLDCHLQRMGRSMAFTFVELREPNTQRLLARGNHTKYITAALKSDKNVDPRTFAQ